MQARVCQRAGCGKELRKKNGDPDFKRRFCSTDCLKLDRVIRLRFDRELARRKRIPAPAVEKGREARAGLRFWIRGRNGVEVGVLTIGAAAAIASCLGQDLASLLVLERRKTPRPALVNKETVAPAFKPGSAPRSSAARVGAR